MENISLSGTSHRKPGNYGLSMKEKKRKLNHLTGINDKNESFDLTKELDELFAPFYGSNS